MTHSATFRGASKPFNHRLAEGKQLLKTFCGHSFPRTVSSTPQEEDKRAALALLLLVARCGRVHREMVCDGAGMGQLVAGCRAEERRWGPH